MKTCPKCERNVFENETACSNCGTTVNSRLVESVSDISVKAAPSTKPRLRKVLVVSAVVAVALIGGVFGLIAWIRSIMPVPEWQAKNPPKWAYVCELEGKTKYYIATDGVSSQASAIYARLGVHAAEVTAVKSIVKQEDAPYNGNSSAGKTSLWINEYDCSPGNRMIRQTIYATGKALSEPSGLHGDTPQWETVGINSPAESLRYAACWLALRQEH